MHGHQLALQMRGDFGEFNAVLGSYGAQIVAIGLRMGGAFQINQPCVGRNLDAFVAKACGPTGQAVQGMEGCFVTEELCQEDGWALQGLHVVSFRQACSAMILRQRAWCFSIFAKAGSSEKIWPSYSLDMKPSYPPSRNTFRTRG